MSDSNARIHSNLGHINAGDDGKWSNAYPSPDCSICSNLSLKFASAAISSSLARGAAEGDVALLAAVVGSPTKRHA